MNEYVLDVNILFSAIISGKDIYWQIVTKDVFYLPDFALTELQIYENLLLEKTKFDRDELKEYTIRLFKKMVVVPRIVISDNNLLKVISLCGDIDEKDIMYIALALELNVPLITRDKELYAGLKAKGFENVILFDDFFQDNEK
jgi:predicted nucleic acid-binding protein